jgi:RNA polymerase subunit RPABC4/transcription elongation factor Spt4
VVRVGLIVVTTYLLALWIAAIWWTFQDIRNRSTDILLQIAATLLVTVFSFPGLLIYFMLRPQRTLAELYDESLEEEALLRTMRQGSTCPSCEGQVEPEFLFCPWCEARLKQLCARCERPISLEWQICPYCGASPQAAQATVNIVPTTAPPSRELVNR